MWYEQKGVSIMAGTIKQITGFSFSFPNILAFMIINYYQLASLTLDMFKNIFPIPQIEHFKYVNNSHYLKMIGQQRYTGNREQAIEIKSLERQISQLKSQVEQKDRKIIDLQNKVSELAVENTRMKEDLRNKDILIKSYNHNLHNKNVLMNKLEADLKASMDSLISKKTKEQDQLKLIISGLEEEVKVLMGDHELMVGTFQEVHSIEENKAEERQLLKDFNSQLQTQVEELESQNQLIITELQETRKQLELQNMQGEDLISQMEVIAEQVGINVSQ